MDNYRRDQFDQIGHGVQHPQKRGELREKVLEKAYSQKKVLLYATDQRGLITGEIPADHNDESAPAQGNQILSSIRRLASFIASVVVIIRLIIGDPTSFQILDVLRRGQPVPVKGYVPLGLFYRRESEASPF